LRPLPLAFFCRHTQQRVVFCFGIAESACMTRCDLQCTACVKHHVGRVSIAWVLQLLTATMRQQPDCQGLLAAALTDRQAQIALPKQ
jgi:hypothetical protein